MIEIPLHIFILVYVVFLGIFGFFFVVNILHLIGTGTFTRPVMLFTAILIAASLFVLEITSEILLTVDLGQPLTFDMNSLGNSLTKGVVQ